MTLNLHAPRSPMTESEMKEAAARLGMLLAAKGRLAEAQARLALLNKHGPGKIWQVCIRLKEPERYSYERPVEMSVTVPFGVIQQQAVYEVQDARREVILLGGQP